MLLLAILKAAVINNDLKAPVDAPAFLNKSSFCLSSSDSEIFLVLSLSAKTSTVCVMFALTLLIVLTNPWGTLAVNVFGSSSNVSNWFSTVSVVWKPSISSWKVLVLLASPPKPSASGATMLVVVFKSVGCPGTYPSSVSISNAPVSVFSLPATKEPSCLLIVVLS